MINSIRYVSPIFSGDVGLFPFAVDSVYAGVAATSRPLRILRPGSPSVGEGSAESRGFAAPGRRQGARWRWAQSRWLAAPVARATRPLAKSRAKACAGRRERRAAGSARGLRKTLRWDGPSLQCSASDCRTLNRKTGREEIDLLILLGDQVSSPKSKRSVELDALSTSYCGFRTRCAPWAAADRQARPSAAGPRHHGGRRSAARTAGAGRGGTARGAASAASRAAISRGNRARHSVRGVSAHASRTPSRTP